MDVSERSCKQVEDTIGAGAQASSGVTLDGRPILGLVVPALNDTPTLTVDVSPDGGSTWLSLLEDDGSTEAISISGGAAAFAVGSDEMSQLAAYVGQDVLVRIYASVAQTSERTFTWLAVA